MGGLYLREGTHLRPLLLGGGQEKGLRAGTENAALACGFAAAYTTIMRDRTDESVRLQNMRESFIREATRLIPGIVVNGAGRNMLPHVANISIPNIDAEYVALALDHRGIAVSTKTSCEEGERESRVVKLLGGASWRASSSLRFSFGKETSEADIYTVIKYLAEIVANPATLLQ